jgi:hypothetical protein
LALGIDTAAHETALECGGRTVAVLGTGLRRIYPASNAALAQRMVEAGGALLTQFFPEQPPTRWTFPNRAVVMSSLSLATVVVEVVPMTSALNPSPWYMRLATYKAGNPEYRQFIGSLAYTSFAAQAGPIAALLGGEPTLLTIVPSKRGVDYEAQPLRRALALVPPLAERLVSSLCFASGGRAGRHRHERGGSVARPRSGGRRGAAPGRAASTAASGAKGIRIARRWSPAIASASGPAERRQTLGPGRNRILREVRRRRLRPLATGRVVGRGEPPPSSSPKRSKRRCPSSERQRARW